MALNQDVDQQLKSGGSKLVVRIDEDSDLDLQALFDTVLKPDSKRPLQVPLRMRKLPNSFFNPPSTGSKSPSIAHSRENSADSAFGSSGSSGGGGSTGTGSTTGTGTGTTNNNSNSNSGTSGGGVSSGGATGGVSAAATSVVGLTVAHPRAHSSPASLQQTYAVGQQQQALAAGHQHVKQRSYDVVSTVVEDHTPLPPGWEQARTPEGQVYYLNHITRSTTWEDPRKNLNAHQQQQQQQQQLQQNVTQQAQSQVTNSSGPANKTSSNAAIGSLPDGWEQAATAEGEVYFINHQTRTTSWFDPRIPVHLQRSPGSTATLLQQNNWLNPLTSQTQAAIQATQQKMRLQSLQMERDRLKQRQQEIRRQQELMLRASSTDLPMDPFLSGLADHSRQESGDSGLGMGTTYSMPHTPEDFLANIDGIDNMDCVSEGGVSTSMDTPDISSLNDNIDSTDDLVPSLQLGEEFPNVTLDDVQSLINPSSTKPDNVLTWL